jgi:hypothetical protein
MPAFDEGKLFFILIIEIFLFYSLLIYRVALISFRLEVEDYKTEAQVQKSGSRIRPGVRQLIRIGLGLHRGGSLTGRS